MAAALPPVALVTGASRGIGRAIAQKLAARGVRIALHYHQNEPAAQATLATLSGSGHRLFAADLTVPDSAARLIQNVLRACGSLDLLVNNAGIYEEHAPADTSLSSEAWELIWERTLAADLTAPAHLSFHAIRHMQSRGPGTGEFGRGRIVNISSRGAFRGEPRAPAYGAAKAGLNAFGQSLARALAPEQIYVFTVAPGWVDTDMARPHLAGPQSAEIQAQHPLGRVTTAEEVATAATWLALDAPATLTGAIVDANGASYLRT